MLMKPLVGSLRFKQAVFWKAVVHYWQTRPLHRRNRENRMEHALSFATWFWLIVPMCTVVLLSLVTYLLGR
jgi:hypothetical protein